MVNGAWEPIDFLAEFRERETSLREVTELLKEKAQCETGKLWAHHSPRIVDALGLFQGLLQDEIDHFGEWRYHEFQPDEVLDFIDQDLDKLAMWLCRMTNRSLPKAESLRILNKTFIPARAYDFTEILKRLHTVAVGPHGKASASRPVLNGERDTAPQSGRNVTLPVETS